ncbi:hypothetical protein [Longispora albida]|uniref:hypothetical protein n=1 Tax=Longispora albida TaxID=203523 RepID=UPI0003A3DEEF|nr:hypothetical protein [Longispora albida]
MTKTLHTFEVSLAEARTRFPQLVSFAELSGQTTLIWRDGRAIAAIVPARQAQAPQAPAPAPRAPVQPSPAPAPPAAAAAGWEKRLTQLRDQLHARHRAEMHDVLAALGQAWEELSRLSPPGTDRSVDRLRAAHQHLLGRS